MDWICWQCGTNNFARNISCYRCRLRKGEKAESEEAVRMEMARLGRLKAEEDEREAIV